MLDLEGNVLTGDLNVEDLINSRYSLKSLRLSFNLLEGTLNGRIGDFMNLKELWLANNNLSGKVPVSICGLKNLSKFKVIFILPTILSLWRPYYSLYCRFIISLQEQLYCKSTRLFRKSHRSQII